MAERQKSFAANRLAAYFGYVLDRYIDRHCKITKFPTEKTITPSMHTIQWMSARAVQPNKNSPTGGPKTANSAGFSRCSCTGSTPFRLGLRKK